MISAEAIAAVLGFERIFEVALAGLFKCSEIKAYTTQAIVRSGDPATDQAAVEAGYELLDFQKDRPRVEIMFMAGAGAGQWNNKVIDGTERPVETSWKGQYKLDILTAADMRIHDAFRLRVRYIMLTQLLNLNGNQLTFHLLHTFYRDGGTTPVLKPQEGIFQTTMLFEVDFSIQDEAWATLAGPPA